MFKGLGKLFLSKKPALSLCLLAGLLFLGSFALKPKKVADTEVAQAQVRAAATDLCAVEFDHLLDSGESTYDGQDVTITSCTFTINGAHTFASVEVISGTLNHSATTTGTVYSIDITTGSFLLDGTSTINVAGWGFVGAYRIGNATSTGYSTGNVTTYGSPGGEYGSGGSHGGLGGKTDDNLLAGISYDDVTNPTEPGGGGGGRVSGVHAAGNGGGLVRLTVTGTATINGTINVSGGNAPAGQWAGGGAGGGIYLNVGTFAGSGIMTANGGNANGLGSGGGGGGRIAVHYDSSSFTGTYQVKGGVKSASGVSNGGAGTIFIKDKAEAYGDLSADNGGYIPAESSTVLPATPTIYKSITLSNDARYQSAAITEVTGTISLNDAHFNRTGVSTIVAPTLTVDNASVFTGYGLNIPTISVLNGSTLRHNATDVTTVYKLEVNATTLTVDGTSTINVAGWGFVGAYRTGNATSTGYSTGNVTTYGSPGGEYGSGGSHGGLGGKTDDNLLAGISYDDVTNPTEPGGGGGGRVSGAHAAGNGGGLVRLTVTGTATIDGTISVNGGDTPANKVAGSGAGGGIYLNVGILAGSGIMTANGGDATAVGAYSSGGGGGGRIAVHYDSSSFTGTYQVKGGIKSYYGGSYGGAGTIFIKDKAEAYGDLSADNGGYIPAESSTVLPANPTIYKSITLSNDARFASNDLSQVTGTFSIDDAWFTSGNTGSGFIVNRLDLTNSAVLTSSSTTVSTIYLMQITADNLTVDSTSTITGAGRGFVGAYRTGNATSTGYSTGNVTTYGSPGGEYGSGGSHGGRGGKTDDNLLAGISYDDVTNPTEPGGGGGGRVSGAHAAGNGGGLVRLTVTGTATIDGTISVNGGDTPAYKWAGSGAGGGIYLNVGTLAGSGIMSANGGDATAVNGLSSGGGGGGRIAVHYDSSSFTGTYQVKGGIKSSGGGSYGGAGTLFIKDNAEVYGDLMVDNNNASTTANTPLFVTIPGGLPTVYTFNDLSVLNLAKLYIDSPCSGTALTVLGATDTSGGGTITVNGSSGCTTSSAALSITTTSPLPVAILSQAYSQTLVSGGGYAPKTWSCLSALGGGAEACTVKLPTGLAMSGAGVISGTPTVAGSYTFYVKVIDSNPGGAQSVERAFSVSVGSAPTAPTTLYAHSTNAQSGSASPASSLDATPAFSAIFSDPDGSDTGAKYQIQVDDTDNTFASLVWDSGASGTALSSSCTNGLRCANISYGGAALTLDGSTYYWRIRYWDNVDIVGSWSADVQFTTDQAPTVPTVLYSNDANAQVGLTNPVGVMAARPVLSAIFNDPDLADTATKYRVQVDNDNDFSSTIWDSGAAGTSLASCGQGTRCADIIFGGTELENNEFVYYWRIKFFDAAGVEGPWSQDPISTNKFTMGAGGSSIQRVQQQQEQNTIPAAPTAGIVEVIDANTVRYNWIDNSNNETGFRVLDAAGTVIAEVVAGITYAVEANLLANTAVSGRTVLAYNSVGQSIASQFQSVITAAPVSQPVVVRRAGDTVTFTIEPLFSDFPDQTALQYELLITDEQGQTRVMSSDWIKQNEYTFIGIAAEDKVQVRVSTRNQAGLQNEPTAYENVTQLSHRFAVNIGVFEKGTNQRATPINPYSILSVSMKVENIGADPATSVTLNLPLPKYLLFRPGSLMADGQYMTDASDNDVGSGGYNGVSATWAQVNPATSHALNFELAFNLEELKNLLSSQSATTTAAVNPIINLQASVSFAESEQIFWSPVITLEPGLDLMEVPVKPEDIPVLLPTKPEVETIDNFITQLLEEEADLIQGPAPEITGEGSIETRSTHDGQSFNIEVSKQEDGVMQTQLSVTGYAAAREGLIEFSGSTSEPNSTVTLVFNGNVTVVVSSDADGYWTTYVSAEQLGLQPGQEMFVSIEAIAAKGDLISDRVSVGNVTVVRGRSGDLTADFETTVSASEFVTTVKEVQKQVIKVITAQEPAIQTTLSVAAPVVIVSSVPLWGYLPYAPTMIYHLLTYFVGFAGRKKRLAARFYGVAYDSINKQPLALAIIRIYKLEATLDGAVSVGAAAAVTKKLVHTVVTDKLGRYDALLEPGQYTLEVAKPGYLFPSQIVTMAQDADFQNVYASDQGLKVEGDTLTIPDLPLDPINVQSRWQLASGPKKVWYALQKVGNYLAVPILLIGAVLSVLVVATIPDQLINWLIAIFYIVLLSLQLKLRQKAEKAWGVVYDIATNAVLPLTTIQLIEPQYGKVVISRLSDYQGRFAFMPEPGKYVIKATKPGFQQIAEVKEAPQTNRQPLSGEVTIEKSDQRISGDVAMRTSA